MGDTKVTTIDTAAKNSRLESFLKGFSISFDVIASRLGPASKDRNIHQAITDLKTEVRDGFAAVAAAIAKLQTPEPPPAQQKGILVARYKFNEDQGPVTFDLIFRGGQTAKGTPVGAGDVDLSIESSIPAILAELGPQVLSEDGNEVKAPVTLTGQQMQNVDLAVVTYRATNRDTGNVLAADSDEFETGPGEVAIGTLDSPVPLEEVVSEPNPEV